MSLSILDVAAYCLIGLALYKFLGTERADLTCPEGPNTKDKSACREGNGKSYAGSLPKKTDKIATLLKKIVMAATATRKDVVWRKSFIVGCACCILFFLVLRRFPTGAEAILTVLMVTTVSYFSHSCYNYHHYRHMEENIVAAAEIIGGRLRSR